jgi:hypothetical protein
MYLKGRRKPTALLLSTGPEAIVVSTREVTVRARKRLLNGGDELSYFEDRGLIRDTIARAFIGYEPEVYFPGKNGRGYEGPAFLYPCVGGGRLLAIHYKSIERDEKGKRRQKWGGFADDLPHKGHGKKPEQPAKIIPFGLETLEGLEPGSLMVLCCGEEDALSLRQVGLAAVSQPGAGLLEPVYAAAFGGFEVVVFYDAGEEEQARKDALKVLRAGAAKVRLAEWPSDAPHGTDINGCLVENSDGFKSRVAGMIDSARALSMGVTPVDREGVPNSYTASTVYVPEGRVWPTLRPEALSGLPGEIVRAIEPPTEADPVAVLTNQLGAFGNAIGRGSYVQVGADRHHLNLDIAIVGETAKGRKGSSWGPVRELMYAADPGWEERVQGGLSTGEGLIYAVRDRVVSGEDEEGEPVVYDEGVEDKRFFVIAGEFASVLSVMRRQGNTLSVVIRLGWDGDPLQVLTRKDPMKATGAHISIIVHITKTELLRHLTETESANGFANRFIWLMVKRSKELPFGGGWHTVNTAPMVASLRAVLEFGKSAGKIVWGESAKGLWREVYGPLSEGKPGLFGAVVGRAEAQVLRLAAIYAVMNESQTIEREHLKAALALWDYAEESARYIFGDATGDPVADRILDALWAAGNDGLTRTEIRDIFKRHKSANEIDRALALLSSMGRIRRESEPTGGRPTERWFLR